jgi:hypothetical protein
MRADVWEKSGRGVRELGLATGALDSAPPCGYFGRSGVTHRYHHASPLRRVIDRCADAVDACNALTFALACSFRRALLSGALLPSRLRLFVCL